MNRFVSICLLFPVLAGAENLLVNPGFEELDGDRPKGWFVFVEPKLGAEGRLDGEVSLEGTFSARLHNPEKYKQEPANNWSQNVIAGLGGEELMVTGNIKTDDVTEAALWVQCFRRSPWSGLLFKTTSTDNPVYGTRDWTPVELPFEAPEGTDLIIVRCVIKGRGTAWFDEVRLIQGKGVELARPDALKEREKDADEGGRTGKDTELRKDLLETYEAVVQANQVLRQTNEALQQELEALRREVRELQREVRAGPRGARGYSGTPSAGSGVPPLVPHGYDWEKMLR